MLAGRYDQVQAALDIFVKDMGLVSDAADAAGLPSPVARAAQRLYLDGRRAGLGRVDDAAALDVARDRSAPPSH